jgi:hypothetical protein
MASQNNFKNRYPNKRIVIVGKIVFEKLRYPVLNEWFLFIAKKLTPITVESLTSSTSSFSREQRKN